MLWSIMSSTSIYIKWMFLLEMPRHTVVFILFFWKFKLRCFVVSLFPGTYPGQLLVKREKGERARREPEGIFFLNTSSQCFCAQNITSDISAEFYAMETL